jgi:hypothetical protein
VQVSPAIDVGAAPAASFAACDLGGRATSGPSPLMGVLDAVEGARFSPHWGVSPGPWLWATRLRVLMVIDGRINDRSDPGDFGLGPVLGTLRKQFAWWVKIEVDVAKRDGSSAYGILGDTIRYRGFRFTQAGFDIDAYDQVWFFGDHPGEASDGLTDDGIVDDPAYSPMSVAELRVVAQWMDRGGGVFATGDHGLLGASMCSRIPRVGSMRKWTHAQGVPPREGPGRHETLTSVWPTDPGSWEFDNLPQPIRPVFRASPNGPIFTGLRPHPLLCAPTGPIVVLPDHMHEGAVVPAHQVNLGRTFEFNGYQRAEYPSRPPLRPRPDVIAHGSTTNPDAPAREFGLISVYDGEPVGCGRVVVDSTWHHWLSMNLLGLRDHNPTAYQQIQAYHRNVALWLATPEQRASMLFAATFGGIAGSPPMVFQRGMGPWDIGQKVLDVIGRTASQCLVDELVGVFAGPIADDSSDEEPRVPPVEPSWSVLPSALVNRAIVGGIGTALLDLIAEYRVARATGDRPSLDPGAIRRRGVEGALAGRRLLIEAVDRAHGEISEVRRRLDRGPAELDLDAIAIPVEPVPLRLVVEWPSTGDGRKLMSGEATLTLRARIDDFVLGEVALDGTDEGPSGGATARWTVAEFAAQAGEELTVEVLSSPDSAGSPRRVLFGALLDGDPSGWIGWHRFEALHPSPPWYRVEAANTDAD